MICTECCNALLEASPAELAGAFPSEMAAHLTTCDSCRAVAASLRDALHAYTSAWEGLAPRRESALVAGAAVESSHVPGSLPYRLKAPTRWRLPWWVTGAAAAAVGLVVAALGGDEEVVTPPTVLQPAPSVDAVQSVVVPEGRNAIIMKTNNPDITVVWFY